MPIPTPPGAIPWLGAQHTQANRQPQRKHFQTVECCAKRQRRDEGCKAMNRRRWGQSGKATGSQRAEEGWFPLGLQINRIPPCWKSGKHQFCQAILWGQWVQMQPLSAFKTQKTPEGDFRLHREPPAEWENKWHHDRLGYASACQSIRSYHAASQAAWRKLAYAWAIPSQQIKPLLHDSTLFAWPWCWKHSQGQAAGRHHFHPFPVEKEAPESTVSAEHDKEKTFYPGNKVLSCSAAVCSDETKGREGYIPVSVMLMWIINHRKDWGEAVDLYPCSLFQKLGLK